MNIAAELPLLSGVLSCTKSKSYFLVLMSNMCVQKADKIKQAFHDIEELPRLAPRTHVSKHDKLVPEKAIQSQPRSVKSVLNGVTWLQPTSLAQVFQLMVFAITSHHLKGVQWVASFLIIKGVLLVSVSDERDTGVFCCNPY